MMRTLIRASIAGDGGGIESPCSSRLTLFPKRLPLHRPSCFRFSTPSNSASSELRTHSASTSPPAVRTPDVGSQSHVSPPPQPPSSQVFETQLEKIIYSFRFVSFLGVMGSLVGSFLCFIKGCTYVANSFAAYVVNRSKVVVLLVEAIDVYLLGTVMLVFGMGLYELFVSNLDIAQMLSAEKGQKTSNLFGMFTLKERPRWLEIKTVSELKTKLGHVIVMLLLIGLFDKSKKAAINTPFDLLCFSASVLLSSGSLYLLAKLTEQ